MVRRHFCAGTGECGFGCWGPCWCTTAHPGRRPAHLGGRAAGGVPDCQGDVRDRPGAELSTDGERNAEPGEAPAGSAARHRRFAGPFDPPDLTEPAEVVFSGVAGIRADGLLDEAVGATKAPRSTTRNAAPGPLGAALGRRSRRSSATSPPMSVPCGGRSRCRNLPLQKSARPGMAGICARRPTGARRTADDPKRAAAYLPRPQLDRRRRSGHLRPRRSAGRRAGRLARAGAAP